MSSENTDLRAILESALDSLGLDVGHDAIGLMLEFWDLVLAANVKINVVSRRTSREEGLVLHVADSLTALKLDLPVDGLKVLDFGSGGGFPGMPLKIARPDWHMTLGESTGKKADFLGRAGDALGLKRLEIFPYYIGGVGYNYRGRVQLPMDFDLVTARAVDTALEVIRNSKPFIREGGLFVAYKGPGYRDEIKRTLNSIVDEGMVLERVEEFDLPLEGEPERALLVFRKQA